jgi:hypothetical protein
VLDAEAEAGAEEEAEERVMLMRVSQKVPCKYCCWSWWRMVVAAALLPAAAAAAAMAGEREKIVCAVLVDGWVGSKGVNIRVGM